MFSSVFNDGSVGRSVGTQVSRCGDGLVDVENGEQCDDGNSDIHDNCLGRMMTSGFCTRLPWLPEFWRPP